MTPLERLDLDPFSPPRALKHPLAQTIIPYYLPIKEIAPVDSREYIELQDSDKIAVALSKPESWSNGQRIVVLIHGLAGCEDSTYLKRIGKKLYDNNYLVIRVNLRACGPGRGLAKNPYHSGRSEDTRSILHWINKKYPQSPITQIGFSLSANITLKMLGENNEDINEALDTAIAVSPPLSLGESAKKMTEDHFKIFNHFFLLQLKKHAQEIETDFPNLHEKISWPKKMNLIDFDHLYTAPRSGFKDAFDYYEKSSCLQFVEKVKRKTLILLSKDDPVVDTSGLHQLTIPQNIECIETQNGGHVGFLEKNRFWMDELIIRWVKNIDHSSATPTC